MVKELERQTAQQFRALIVPPEDEGSILTLHQVTPKHLYLWLQRLLLPLLDSSIPTEEASQSNTLELGLQHPAERAGESQLKLSCWRSQQIALSREFSLQEWTFSFSSLMQTLLCHGINNGSLCGKGISSSCSQCNASKHLWSFAVLLSVF